MTVEEQALQMFASDMIGAERLIQQQIDKDPKAWRAWSILGYFQSRRHETVGAIGALRRSAELNPESVDNYFNLGYLYHEQGNLEKARDFYAEAHRRSNGKYLEAGLLLGRTLHRMGDLDGAAKTYESLLAAHGSSLRLAFFRARLLLERGDLKNANRFFTALSGRLPDNEQGIAELVSFFARYDYPEWQHLDNKARLQELVAAWDADHPDDPFGYHPRGYELPQQREALTAAHQPGDLWILKPTALAGGQEARVIDSLDDIPADQGGCIAQRYVPNPLLIDGRKFNMRLYLLITSLDPLRAWWWQDGVAVIAAEPFAIDHQSLQKVAAHVVNPLRMNDHPDMQVSADANADGEGNVWSFHTLLRRLTEDGHDPEKMLTGLQAMAERVLALIEHHGIPERATANGIRYAFAPKIIGMDVLLTDELEPRLLEIERFPGLSAPAHDAVSLRLKSAMRRDWAELAINPLAGEAGLSAGDDIGKALAVREDALATQYAPLRPR